MAQRGGPRSMCLNKVDCHSSSTLSSSSEQESEIFTKLKVSLTEDYPQKNAEILSGQYGINLLLIGVSLMLAIGNNGASVKEEHLLSFITALIIVQLLWMMWYIVRRGMQSNLQAEKDRHATTSWIKGGLTLLALLSLIMDAFNIGYFVGYRSCLSAVLVVYPIIHATHTIAQVHFLWFHIKDVIKSFETFERFGVIHAVFTNLLLWCSGVMSEANHLLNHHNTRLTALGFENLTMVAIEPHCNCTISACSMFVNGLYYLYPFNIEYHIFVSVMLFVMWKNIGRTIDLEHNRKRPATKTQGLVVGPILGLAALASTIGVLVVYIIHVEESLDIRESTIAIFYYYGIVMLVVMCSAGVTGLLIYRADPIPLETTKNPSRKLDTELLFGSSVGSWLVSWCSVVAVSASRSSPSYRWTNLMYSLLSILEKYIQNLFIIESLYRQREDGERENAEVAGPAPEIFSMTSSLSPPYNGIINQAYENPDNGSVTLENVQKESGQVNGCPQKHLEVPRQVENNVEVTPSKKSQILKNIAVLLFMCNISLWILPAFGCRPQYDNGLEEETYGFTTWTTVLNFAMPITLFYRMHSVACLFEVFRRV
ncbi:proton channel OTOP1-like [Oncorhynchus masou masou]|uniref:proton channel OTOP1-like n=1 Tax=Oncorhynchus masou masou TaxID=90313 RepID=UPI0031846003